MKELAAVQKKSSNNLFEKSLYCCSVKTLSSVFKLNPWVPCRAADLDWWLVQEQDHQDIWSDSNITEQPLQMVVGSSFWRQSLTCIWTKFTARPVTNEKQYHKAWGDLHWLGWASFELKRGTISAPIYVWCYNFNNSHLLRLFSLMNANLFLSG